MANLKIFAYFVISNNKSFISQNLKVVGPLGGKFDFFSPSEFEIQTDFDYKPQNKVLLCESFKTLTE